jgi:hypothetical protein
MATLTVHTPIKKIASFITNAIGNVGQSVQSGEVAVTKQGLISFKCMVYEC